MWRGSKAAPVRPTFLNFVLANDTRDWLNSTGRPAHYVTMSNHVQLIMRIVGLRSASGNGWPNDLPNEVMLLSEFFGQRVPFAVE